MRSSMAVGVLAAFLLVIPGSAERASGIEGGGVTVLKIALIAPRSPLAEAQTKKWNQRFGQATNGKLQVKVYLGGVAGDDRAVFHKMFLGQLDATAVQATSLAPYIRQAQLLSIPGLFFNYRQLDAAFKELAPAFDEEAYKNGLKVLGWGDVGTLRMFSRQPVRTLADLRRMRLWLWEEQPIMKDLYQILGVVGVPMGITEVFAGLQTRMIDVVWCSALGAAALQWTNSAPFVSKQGAGYIAGAFVLSRRKYDTLEPMVAKALMDMAHTYQAEMVGMLRKADDTVWQHYMTKGGVKIIPVEDEQEWYKVFKQLRERFVGRLYSREMLTRVEKICDENK